MTAEEAFWKAVREGRSYQAAQLAAARAAVAAKREELGIDPHHDCGADSGSLDEQEERERSERPR